MDLSGALRAVAQRPRAQPGLSQQADITRSPLPRRILHVGTPPSPTTERGNMVDVSQFSMGATAAIITSTALIAGIHQGASARVGVITGLLVVAIADNISDSLGIHIYKESEGASQGDIKSTTLGNFLVRLFLVLTFVAIVAFSSSRTAFVVSSVWGLVLLAVLSYLIAKKRKKRLLREVLVHLAIALAVIAGCKLMGYAISQVISHTGL